MATLADLAKRTRKIDKELPDRVSALTVAVTLELVEDLAAIETPVDTSHALSNWQASFGFRPDSFLPPYVEGEGGSSRTQSAEATLNIAEYSLEGRKLGQVIYLSNNAPYIVDLNNGSSKQAPSGWVQTSIINAKKFAQTLKGTLLKGL